LHGYQPGVLLEAILDSESSGIHSWWIQQCSKASERQIQVSVSAVHAYAL